MVVYEERKANEETNFVHVIKLYQKKKMIK